MFKRQRVRGGTVPQVTVQRHGMLSLNRMAYEALGEPDAVKLLFDRGERAMGLRPALDGSTHAYRVCRQSSGSGFLVSGRAFTQKYGIPVDTAHRLGAATTDNVLIVNVAKINGKTKAVTECRDRTAAEPHERVEDHQG